MATTSLENDITFPAAGENDANQPISPNKTTREQALNPADPELQNTGKVRLVLTRI